MKRAWKKLPPGVRASAHRGARSLMEALTPAMVAMMWRRGLPGGGPITVAGLHRSSIGLGRGARLFTAALRAQGRAIEAWDVGPAVQVPADLQDDGGSVPPTFEGEPPRGGVLISHLNPPELTLWLQRTGCRGLRGRRHIGYWAWELPTLPEAWKPAFAFVDEVWCPSTFTAEAVRAAAPPDLPVRVAAHPMFMTPEPCPDRARFGLSEQACVLLTALDLKSTSARKNPLGAIQAYRIAVPVPHGRSVLVCKVAGSAQFPERLAEVEAAAGGRADILLMKEALSEAEMMQLVASVDVILSLHRAEGFGLLPAEALWLGRCVVATAWSGVMDFLDADSAALVPWTPGPVHDVQAMYAGGWWAEPDIDAAGAAIAALVRDPVARAAMAARARARAHQVFAPDVWGAHVQALLGGSHGGFAPALAEANRRTRPGAT